ncbi:alpha/beta hydrolase-fold protein [Balneola sp. MJW-20]|uniref:alpha/beta hydrolase n=1 Tax=Gracilimonas aurantiaca TaxID=3234185 RepID=UPI003467A862
MKSVITILLLFITASPVLAQQTERLQEITFPSEVMDQDRTIKIYVPKDYSEEKSYPVIYITDGSNVNFNVAANYLDGLSETYFNLIPQSILVGIHHNRRNDDLDVHDSESGKVFMEYLHEELLPYMDSTYSTSGFNAMIGHSNGAEYNHFLMMSENNPFRGFISMSTSFNTDVRDRLADFFNSYEGKNIYYFIGNATFDSPERPRFGNEFAEIYANHPNPNVELQNQTYAASHMSIVPVSLFDGLRFVFKDYYAITAFPEFTDYSENYLNDLKDNYGLEGTINPSDLENYLMDILTNKKLDEYERLIALEAEHKLFLGKGMDPINIANHYYLMEAYDKTIEYYNDALENYDQYVEEYPDHFERMYRNMLRQPIGSYEKTDQIDELIDFLERSIEVLPEKSALSINHKIAKLSVEHQTSLELGKKALAYCKSNYRENTSFTMDDLIAMEEKLN